MSATIPASHLDLISEAVFAILTTLSPSGAPENTVVWCSWDGQYVLVNTAEGRRKPANVRRDPRVALAAIDPQDPHRWIDVRGVVEEIVDDPEYHNIDAHARLYTGKNDFYGGVVPIEKKGTEKRIIFKIRPLRVVTS